MVPHRGKRLTWFVSNGHVWLPQRSHSRSIWKMLHRRQKRASSHLRGSRPRDGRISLFSHSVRGWRFMHSLQILGLILYGINRPFNNSPPKMASVDQAQFGPSGSTLRDRAKIGFTDCLRSRFSYGDVGANHIDEVAGGFEGFLRFMVRNESGVVIKGHIPISAETVEDNKQASMLGVNSRSNEFDDRLELRAKRVYCARQVASTQWRVTS